MLDSTQPLLHQCCWFILLLYLLKPGASQLCEATWNDPEFQNWGNLEFSAAFHSSSFNPQMPKFKCFGPNSLNILSQTLHVPYFECPICFWKFWTQILKFGYFRPKSMNFLILTKFPIYSISQVLISNFDFWKF